MGKAWFAPKSVGYGSGLPISWEGWAVLIGFFVLMAVSRALVHRLVAEPYTTWAWLGCVAVLVTILLLIARAKTEGGWRWRNGRD